MPAFSDNLNEFDSPVVFLMAKTFGHSLMDSWSFCGTFIDVLAAHIVILDARSTARPEILHSEEVKILYRNLFLTVVMLVIREEDWHLHSESRLGSLIVECIRPFQESKKPNFSFESLGEFKGDLHFYRQLALFGHFMLGIPFDDDIIDWDDVLEPASLTHLFNLEGIPTEEMYIYKPIDLPNDWVDLLVDPFNLNIARMDLQRGICLLTGTILCFEQSDEEPDDVFITSYCHETWKGGPFPMLFLTGPEATGVKITSAEFNVFVPMNPVWVDVMDLPDPGLSQGRLLSLKRDGLSEMLDDFASGKFHNKMQ
jgi:hypothetical protein